MTTPTEQSVDELMSYYASIAPQPEQLRAALQQPLPTSLAVNTLKISREDCAQHLAELGIASQAMPWNSVGLKLDKQSSGIGCHWPYQTGLYQTQEEVSLIPAIVLNPQPGDRVLDLCAAPGGKTAQMSVMMQNSGTVIANDRNYGRLRAMGHMIKRLGLTNIATTALDGTSYPALREHFDCVMADVPCSCEGTWRKHRRQPILPSRKKSLAISRIQYRLLEKALQLTRAGGRVLYSTCTFAPEENERVLQRLLDEYGEYCRILPIELPHWKSSPGVTSWQGEEFHSDVRHAMRVWPHQNNSGGFFVALIEKTKPTSRYPARITPMDDQSITDPSIAPILETVLGRFGIDPEILADFRVRSNNRRGLYLYPSSLVIPNNLPIDAAGLFSIKTKTKHDKLSTQAAMWLTPKATQNIIALSCEQRDGYLKRENILLTPEQVDCITGTGYVLTTYSGIGLGIGVYLEYKEGAPELESLFPKSL